MSSPNLYVEISLLQQQLESASKSFDMAIKKDAPLGEAKKIFHEMKTLTCKLNELQKDYSNED